MGLNDEGRQGIPNKQSQGFEKAETIKAVSGSHVVNCV